MTYDDSFLSHLGFWPMMYPCTCTLPRTFYPNLPACSPTRLDSGAAEQTNNFDPRGNYILPSPEEMAMRKHIGPKVPQDGSVQPNQKASLLWHVCPSPD